MSQFCDLNSSQHFESASNSRLIWHRQIITVNTSIMAKVATFVIFSTGLYLILLGLCFIYLFSTMTDSHFLGVSVSVKL
jgi:hypothetical protein